MFEMNDNQKALFEKLTPLQKEISLNSISGKNDIDAYKASKGKAKTVKTMQATVSEILSNPNVQDFIKSMAVVVVQDAIMSRDEMLAELSLIARVSMPKLDNNGLALLSEVKGGLDIKLKAIKQITDLAGYDAASKFDHSSSDGSMSPSKNMSDEQLIAMLNE
jgi:phage terminase small subunit